ncbi:MAG: hypothetical protein NUV50_08230 [Rhodospirillales bacterium]|nr:hypothetical protein [Rhodospirillales bacterium]
MDATGMKHFKDLIVALYRDGEKARNERITTPGIRNRVAELGSWQWIASEYEINRLLTHSSGTFGNKVFYLRPPSGMQNAVIALWAEWSFDKKTDKDFSTCKLEIMIKRAENQVYGFRFESPHARNKHKYWHAQFNNNFSNSQFWPASAPYIDDSTPAFPILVTEEIGVTPKDVAAYATVSLYGREMHNDLLTKLKTAIYSISLKKLLPLNDVA